MKISIDSLNSYLSKSLSLDEILDTLLKTEIEVEQVISSNNFHEKIVVGEIKSISGHPNADNLSLVKVSIGDKADMSIVCGAKNIKLNQKVPIALVGAVLPDGLKIKKAKIRNEVSNGMICSAAELNISADDSGILVLENSLKVGLPLKDAWSSGAMLDIKTPANRWDYLSLIGIAREVSVFSKVATKLNQPMGKEIIFDKKDLIKVSDKKYCPRFVSARLKVNLKGKGSPAWLVDFLKKNDFRSINPVVDVLNFVMIETGQPSHAYDADKIKGQIEVRFAKTNEALIALDDDRLELSKDDLVVADQKGPLALAGVVGGKYSEVSDDTKEIILETANFDKAIIRKSALRHGKRTEASSRFERGLPLPLQILAFERIINLLEEIADAKIVTKANDQLYSWPWTQHIGLRMKKAQKFIGVELDENLVIEGLEKLGYQVEHFSLSKEAKKHLGKPYKWGASYKKDGVSAFDCSYLTDYIYSLIGKDIGHTAFEQYKKGQPVDKIKPGDLVFYSGNWVKLKAKERGDVGHCGIYLGQDKVLMASEYRYKKGQWVREKNPKVVEVPLSEFTDNPGYKGARRYVDSLNHILAITCPWWRTDLRFEEDVLEEIVKLIGYNNLPQTSMDIPPMDVTKHQILPNIMKFKQAIASSGLTEVLTYSLISQNMIEDIGLKPSEHLKLANPLTSEQAFLRTDLLANFMQVISNNVRETKNNEFFEISKLHLKNKKNNLPAFEPWVIGIAVYGKDSLMKLKGIIDYISSYFRVSFEIKSDQLKPNFISGRVASIDFARKDIGYFGQVDYSLLDQNDIPTEVSFAQIYLDDLLLTNRIMKISNQLNYQEVSRDVSLVVPLKKSWQSINATVSKIDKVVSVDFITDYIDDKMLKSNKKSVSFKVKLDMGAKPVLKEINQKLEEITDRCQK